MQIILRIKYGAIQQFSLLVSAAAGPEEKEVDAGKSEQNKIFKDMIFSVD